MATPALAGLQALTQPEDDEDPNDPTQDDDDPTASLAAAAGVTNPPPSTPSDSGNLPLYGAGVGTALDALRSGGDTSSIAPGDLESALEIRDSAEEDTLKHRAAIEGLQALIRGSELKDNPAAAAEDAYTKSLSDADTATRATVAADEAKNNPAALATAARAAAEKLAQVRAQFVEPEQLKATADVQKATIAGNARTEAERIKGTTAVTQEKGKTAAAQNAAKLYAAMIARGTTDPKTQKLRPYTAQEIAALPTSVPALRALLPDTSPAGPDPNTYSPGVEKSIGQIQEQLHYTRPQAVAKLQAMGVDLGGS
jgi:hypothetical protein